MRKDLRRLPRMMTTWQLGLRRLAPREGKRGHDLPEWLVVVADVVERHLRVVAMVEGEPTSAVLWEHLLTALNWPTEGTPARPAQLVVSSEELCTAWRSRLRELNIACDVHVRPQPVTDLLDGLDHLADVQSCPSWSSVIDVGTLPQSDEVWQVAVLHSTEWITHVHDGAYRPWRVLILNRSSRQMLWNTLVYEPPTRELICDHAVRAMSHPKERGRPRIIEVADPDCYDWLQGLGQFGVTCRRRDELPEMDAFCRKLTRRPGDSNRPPLAETREVSKSLMAAYYVAAEAYFRAQPWRLVTAETAICVSCPELNMTRFAVVLGRTGVQLGCGFYDTYEDYLHTLYGGDPNSLRAVAVCFDDAGSLTGTDLYHIERHGWPIASPEAFPSIWRSEPPNRVRPPSAAELLFVTAALELIPRFLASYGAPTIYNGVVADRELNMRLQW